MSLPLIADSLHHLILSAPDGAPAMSFDLVSLWYSMGWFAKGIAVVLFIMMTYSLGVAGERIFTFQRAGKASRQYAEELRGLLPSRKLTEAIELAKTLHRGHLSKVLGGA